MEVLGDRCLLSAGALDPTFGTGGLVTTSFLSPMNDAGRMAIQADGKIVEAGTSVTGTNSAGGPALARYNADGTLDTTFGTGGTVTPDLTHPGVAIEAIAIQGDGKIVAAGYTFFDQVVPGTEVALLRYNSDGSPDTSFGSGGLVTIPLVTPGDFASAVAIQADGKIVSAGGSFTSSSGFELARYNSDGSLDTTFGTGGEVTTHFAGSTGDHANSVAIQPGGQIVVAGSSFSSSGVGDFALARYNSDGTLDATFGTGGELTTDFAGINQQALSVVIQGDGKLVATGFAFTSATHPTFALARYNTDGSLDTTFGAGGLVTTTFGTNEIGDAVVIQSDGKLVAAGYTFNALNPATRTDFALARYNTDGSLDATFGTGGKLTTDFGNTDDLASSVAIQADGKIVAGGDSNQPGTGYDFALARYGSDGSLDATFGAGGKVTTNIGQGPADAYGRGGVALQADGKIVVAGVEDRGFSFGGNVFALARYNSDGSLDAGFGSGGRVTTSFNGPALATCEAIQADGKIVLAGETVIAGRRLDFALARYNTDGSLDTTFGTGGKVDTDFGIYDAEAHGVAIQADGKIVVAGDAGGAALARYNTDGTLDTSFGTGGKIVTPGIGLNGMAIQADGKIVGAGLGFQKNVGAEFALVRYNTDGSLDTGFGSKGEALTSFGGLGNDVAYSVAIQGDGKIVAAGQSEQTTSYDFALARYNSDGSPDKGFGSKGLVLTSFGGRGYDDAFSVAIQGDGKIVAAGESNQSLTGYYYDFALARYNGDGSPDTSFGNGGLVLTDFGGISQAIGVAIQADGNIVAAGTAFHGYNFDFALARYIGVSPSNPIDTLIANVQALPIEGVLNNGQDNSLLVKLQDAVEHLSDGATKNAVNDLQAFVNEVEDYIAQGLLTSAQGQPLIDGADALIGLLGKK